MGGVMDKIIDDLLALYMERDSSVLESISKEEMDKEWDFYFLILERLSKKDESLFSEYLALRQAREDTKVANAYKQGFQTAVRLLIECLQK